MPGDNGGRSSARATPDSAQLDPLWLDIFEGHRLATLTLRRFRFLVDPRAPALVGLASLLAFLLAALADGDLTQPHLFSLLCQDARSYLQAKPHLCHKYTFGTRLTALRDVPSLILVLTLPMTWPLALRQWDNISRFLSAMAARGNLTFVDKEQVHREVASCNAYFARWSSWNPVVVAASVVAVFVIVRAQTAGLTYPILQTSKAGTDGLPPAGWWLTIIGLTWSGTLYFALGCAVVYIIFLQTIHGSRAVLLVWRLRHSIRGHIIPADPDRYYGWSEVRAILLATWSLIIIHGVCLTMVGLSLPSSQRYEYVLAPLLFQWLIVWPIYLTVPFWITHHNVSAWRHTERARIKAAISTTTDAAKRRTLEQEMMDLRKIHVNPFSGVFQRLLFLVGTVGSAVLVVQIIRFLYY
jgi:hypothetical protein